MACKASGSPLPDSAFPEVRDPWWSLLCSLAGAEIRLLDIDGGCGVLEPWPWRQGQGQLFDCPSQEAILALCPHGRYGMEGQTHLLSSGLADVSAGER